MKDKLKADLKEALKAKDQIKLNTVRAILSAIQYEEMQKGTDAKEDQILAILKNEVKKRKETLEFLEKENRAEEIETTQSEIKILESYLPAQLSEDQITEILNALKTDSPDANMGLAMKHLKDNYPGQYDGKMASSIAKDLF